MLRAINIDVLSVQVMLAEALGVGARGTRCAAVEHLMIRECVSLESSWSRLAPGSMLFRVLRKFDAGVSDPEKSSSSLGTKPSDRATVCCGKIL